MTALDLEVRHPGLLDLFDREQEIITVSDGFQFTEGAVTHAGSVRVVAASADRHEEVS